MLLVQNTMKLTTRRGGTRCWGGGTRLFAGNARRADKGSKSTQTPFGQLVRGLLVVSGSWPSGNLIKSARNTLPGREGSQMSDSDRAGPQWSSHSLASRIDRNFV